MGCFNTVIFKCPSCGGEIAEQVKSGSCTLNTFNEDKVPIDDAGGLIGINTATFMMTTIMFYRDQRRK